MTQSRTITHDRDMEKKHEAAANAEYAGAWIMGLTALILGAIGLLVGFGIIGGADEEIVDVGGVGAEAIEGSVPNWHEGMLWMLPAMAIGLLALTLHQNDHHRGRMATGADSEKSRSAIDHVMAYLAAAATIAAAALGLLIGFDVFDRGNTPGDGFLWSSAGIVVGVLAAGHHAIRHHAVVDEDEVVRILERRTTVNTGVQGQPSLASDPRNRRS